MGPATAGTLDIEARIPLDVRAILERLWSAGFEAYIVGGSLRDLLLGRPVKDWDIATSARPEETATLFPGSVHENRFGTVSVRQGETVCEVTTFRREHVYADHRRPERVEFGVDLEEDLARRDFTMNALAWGGHGRGRESEERRLHDPFDGEADLRAGRIRAVGRPAERFAEDALRMLRAVRFAATLGFSVEPETLAAMARHAALAAHLSGERVQAELRLIIAAPHPSVALRLMAERGLLEACLPDLAAQQGIPQNKIAGQDLWEHTLATVDAVDPSRPGVRLAALLHDVGKPAALSDGHFPNHESVGAEVGERILRALAFPRHEVERVALLVREHMFNYQPAWGDAAVRRFIRRVGVAAIDDLLALREADNVGSGLPREAGHLAQLRARIAAILAARHALRLADLAVDGDDIRTALGIAAGPQVGAILRALLELVIADPQLNERRLLLAAARRLAGEQEAEAER